MSVVKIAEASKSAVPAQASVQKMLIENSQLIETIAEYQKMGRMEDAVKYQELLHQNLMLLGKLVDPVLANQIQEIAPPQVSNTEPSWGISVNVEQGQPPQNSLAPPGQFYSPNTHPSPTVYNNQQYSGN